MFEIYYCPNKQCPYSEKLEELEKCPKCGAKAQKFGIRQGISLLKEKHKPRHSTR